MLLFHNPVGAPSITSHFLPACLLVKASMILGWTSTFPSATYSRQSDIFTQLIIFTEWQRANMYCYNTEATIQVKLIGHREPTMIRISTGRPNFLGTKQDYPALTLNSISCIESQNVNVLPTDGFKTLFQETCRFPSIITSSVALENQEILEWMMFHISVCGICHIISLYNIKALVQLLWELKQFSPSGSPIDCL